MDTASEVQAQAEAREKAAMLLTDRHQRESEALGTLIAAISRRATAEEMVERETRHIASQVVEMARLGFDDAALAELGIDMAAIQDARVSGPWDDGADPVRAAGEHLGGVRTTAHLGAG